MPTVLIVLIPILVILLLLLVSCISIVPQANAYVVEWLGVYQATWMFFLFPRRRISDKLRQKNGMFRFLISRLPYGRTPSVLPTSSFPMNASGQLSVAIERKGSSRLPNGYGKGLLPCGVQSFVIFDYASILA